MLREFRDFVVRGNVIDLAVGLVAGAAFSALVGSLVADVVDPIIAFLIGQPDFSGSLRIELPTLPWAEEPATIALGSLLSATITFLGTMAGIFLLIVKPINSMTRRAGETADADAAEPAQRECPECLGEVPARARRCRHCTSSLEPVA